MLGGYAMDVCYVRVSPYTLVHTVYVAGVIGLCISWQWHWYRNESSCATQQWKLLHVLVIFEYKIVINDQIMEPVNFC